MCRRFFSLQQICEAPEDVVVYIAGEGFVVIADKGAGDEDHHALGLLFADLGAVNAPEACLHDLPPLPKLAHDELLDTLIIMRENIGLRGGVGALLANAAIGDIAHESVHICQIRREIRSVVLRKPLLAFFAHELAGVANIAYYQFLLAAEIIEQLGVRHAGLGGDIAQRDIHKRLFIDTPLKRHENIMAHGILINDEGHTKTYLCTVSSVSVMTTC